MLPSGTCSGAEGKAVLSGVLWLCMVPSHCIDQDVGNGTSGAMCMMKTEIPWGFQFTQDQSCAQPLMLVLWFSLYHLPGVGLWCHQDPPEEVLPRVGG